MGPKHPPKTGAATDDSVIQRLNDLFDDLPIEAVKGADDDRTSVDAGWELAELGDDTPPAPTASVAPPTEPDPPLCPIPARIPARCPLATARHRPSPSPPPSHLSTKCGRPSSTAPVMPRCERAHRAASRCRRFAPSRRARRCRQNPFHRPSPSQVGWRHRLRRWAAISAGFEQRWRWGPSAARPQARRPAW